MSGVPEHKRKEWQARAARKNAIVPYYFEVFVTKVIIQCGACGTEYRRTLIRDLNEPVFVCPNERCRSRNWVPVKFDLK